jgi:hypothetical protein
MQSDLDRHKKVFEDSQQLSTNLENEERLVFIEFSQLSNNDEAGYNRLDEALNKLYVEFDEVSALTKNEP